MLNYKRQRFGTDDGRWCAGAASVELALVAPILIVLFMGVWDFGRALSESARMESAAHAGALYGAQSTAYAANTSGITQSARDDADDTAGALNITADQYCQCPSGATVACNSDCGAEGQPRMFVQVQVTEPFTTWFPYPFVTNPMTLSGQTTLRVY